MFIFYLIRLILFNIILVYSASDFSLSNSEDNFNSFTSRSETCYLEGKVMYHNQCYKLNTQGPCNINEKLVLDIEAATRVTPIFQTICLENACENNDIYWPKDDYCYTQESAKDLCLTKGTSAQIDIFGEGHCDCIKNPPHGRMPNDKLDAPCYKLYTKAQCKQNHILIENNNLKTSCTYNQCSRRGINYVKAGNGNCYKLGTKGPCKENQEFNILEHTRKPGCKNLIDLNPLFVVDVPLNCKTDHSGDCVEEFSIVKGDNFRFQLLRNAERARKRKKKNC